jgi:hypothetical protein
MSGRPSSAERGSLPRQGRGERLPAGRQGFVVRRRHRRRRVLVAFSIIFLLLSAGIAYGLRQSAVRISHIQVFGLPTLPAGRQESLAELATAAMQGNYFGIIPRDSAFFFPAARIRADIVAAYLDIAAVSISLKGLTGLSIKVNVRVPIARWCGSSSDGATMLDPEDSDSRSNLVTDCYFFDANGFVYSATNDTKPVNSFIVHSPLTDGAEAIGSTLQNADNLPAAFDFARELATIGSSVSLVVFRGDEVDMYLKSGTRVTYVLGNEQNAFTALVSARNYLNLADGSIDYVDLRFPGETYFKRKK